MKNPTAIDVLIQLLDDPEMLKHAIYALRRKAPPQAAPHLERFVDHEISWIRDAARKGLEKIEKKLSK